MNQESNRLKDSLLRQLKEMSFSLNDQRLETIISPLWEPSPEQPGVFRRVVDTYGNADYSLLQYFYPAGTRIENMQVSYRLTFTILSGTLTVNGQVLGTDQLAVFAPDVPLTIVAETDCHAIIKMTPKLTQYVP